MLKDPTEFRERFLRWKKGELVYENGLALPAYKDGLMARKKSEVNTNLATYDPEEDLYTARYTVPEVTVTGNKKKVGTGMGKRLYMHPWKTVGDLSREQHETEEIVKKLFGDQQLYDVITKDLRKPLSPVDPVGELVVGNAVLGPAFNYVGKGLNWAGNTITDDVLIWTGRHGNKWARNKAVLRAMGNPIISTDIPTVSYIWKPEYGYRRVLQLPSTINFNDAKFYDSTAGDKSPLNFLFLSDIDRLRKSGIGGLTENAPSQESFKLFFGLYPAEYKSHWYSKLNGMPDSYKEKFVERLLNFDLDRAQLILLDIRRANNPTAYSWNNQVLLDGYDMLRNLYTSNAYKSRWTPSDADAVSSELIQNMREISPILQKRVIVDNDGGVPMRVSASGMYSPNKKVIQVLDNGDQTIHSTTHEFSHASDKGETVDLTGYVKMKPKKSLTQKQFDYYNQDTEKRARIMSLLADMHNRGYNINSYNDIQDYLFFNKAFGNHNVNSIFSNYDIKMTDLLDVMRNAKSIVIPTIGVGTVYGTSNK